ncbi:MAG: amino acid ABC transporter substrate-binding protein [Deltaproteobacteria bacterium]|nr:amino acid ABC transporter substrate-binding protein [Deltaproteobacteria bacterium]
MKRFLSSLALVTLIASVTIGGPALAQADVVKEIMMRGEMVVGVQTQGPPISFIDKDGKRTGLAVEMLRMLAKDMEVKLVLKEYEWKGLIPALLSKKVDFLGCDMTPTIKRSTRLNFTDPYIFSDTVAFALKDSPLNNISQLNSPEVKIAVIQGSSHVGIVQRQLPKAIMKEYAGGGPAVATATMSGRTDVGINGFGVVRGYLKSFKNMKILDGVLKHGPVCWPVRPEDTHLLELLNNFIRYKKADGSLTALVDYWWTTDEWKKYHK